MLIDTPLMPDYGWVSVAYYLWGWRYMGGLIAWNMARNYNQRRPDPNDYGLSAIGGLLVAPVALPFKICKALAKHEDSDMWELVLPNPDAERVGWRERRNNKLQARLKEREARIKQLESEAGIHHG